MIKTIVFDMDGVLIDSEQKILAAWKDIARQKGIPNITATLMKCIGITAPKTEAIFKETYGSDFPYTEYKAKVSAMFHQDINEHGIPLKPGVPELFDYLKSAGYRIGLASSTRKASVTEEMRMAGLIHFFDVIVCGDMVTHSKPHPQIYQTAASLLDTLPEACYAIEDSPNGIRSAHAAGMKPIMVPDLIRPDEEIQKLLYRQFDSLYEVLAYLKTTDEN